MNSTSLSRIPVIYCGEYFKSIGSDFYNLVSSDFYYILKHKVTIIAFNMTTRSDSL